IMAKAQRKAKDRWKSKAWYSLHAPAMFNYAVMAWTPADSPEAVTGRVAEVSLDRLSGDFSQKNYIVRFRVGEVRGPNAFTSYDGHRLTSDYKRALTRRRNTRVDCNFTLTTTDDVRLRLKPILVVDNRIRGSQEKLLRARTTALVIKTISGLSLVEGLKRIYSGELARELAKDLRTIYLTRRVEIAKVEMLSPAKLMDVPPSEEELERILTEEETEDGDDDETDAEVVDYDSLTVPELKELLKAQKLPVSGKKAELVERLSSAGSNEEEEESDD
ncbi:MAG: SAP domain-containing protein, partial [Candidatus Thermoplasmatota archaeon]|nr:SAP domain-containing protein [Candidatus Thermoplasmatota archaeon]